MRDMTAWRSMRLAGMMIMLIGFGLMAAYPPMAQAGDRNTLCAEVKIEIRQELTLERQAFEAHMRINNGAPVNLDNVKIDVVFTDEEGKDVNWTSQTNLEPDMSDPTAPRFFMRVDSLEEIAAIDGSGVVASGTSADIRWLIIPVPGSSNGSPQGTLYYVGATLTYTLSGEEHVTEVTPDYIFVKPLPELTLDYFLPHDVSGDNPLTPDVTEALTPFSLGVRVSNTGDGAAQELKIDSAQPTITENDQDLAVEFTILGSTVNDQAATPSLLADFGTIAPQAASVARWIMTSSLSGKFSTFEASFSHADELGGTLTSLMNPPQTHILMHDVLVDLPGRDAVRDFLAIDDWNAPIYRVYESENTTSEAVSDVSDSASFSGTQLSVPATPGFLTVKLPLSAAFGQSVQTMSAVRSDGKTINPKNVWIAKIWNKDAVLADGWDYFFCLFDVNSLGQYTLTFDVPVVTLTVVNAGTGSGTVLSTGGEIACGEQCSATYPGGTQVTLTATPDDGSTFTGWEGGECSGTGEYTVTVNEDTTITATFEPSQDDGYFYLLWTN